jgi:hypothetical protein
MLFIGTGEVSMFWGDSECSLGVRLLALLLGWVCVTFDF